MELWCIAQKIEEDSELLPEKRQIKTVKKWRPSPDPWLKCNIGSVCSESKQLGGMAWVLRDGVGKVLLHSRRAWAG